MLQELKTSERADPFNIKAIETKVQDNLAAERKAERDRIAKEMLEQLSSASHKPERATQKPFGISSMPSDPMADILHNRYNKDYIASKFRHDGKVHNVKNSKYIKTKTVRDTHANRLLSEAQNIKNQVMNVRSSVEALSPRRDSLLPPLKSVSASQQQLKPHY